MILSKRELKILKNADRQNRYWRYTRYIDLVLGTAALLSGCMLLLISIGTGPLDWSAKLATFLLFGLGIATLFQLGYKWHNEEVRLLLKFASESEVNAA